MWWVLASGGQLDGVVNSMGDYVIIFLEQQVKISSSNKDILLCICFLL
jgi:hypothetical protein